MLESIAWTAFLMGLVSACSLPIGAVTAGFWRPEDRSIAVLMAFGSGALLAALTIDLVGSALESGHFNALAIGAIMGGFLFVGLNRVVNDYGGFMRKASTTIYHLRRKEHQRLRQITRQLNHSALFHELTTRDYKGLAASVRNRQLGRGEAAYQAGDPADGMYIITEGAIELYDPRDTTAPVALKDRYDLLGWRACLLGTPHAHTAVATTDTELWVVPRSAIDALLLNSPEFQQVIHQYLRSGQAQHYLESLHGLDSSRAADWLDTATNQLVRSGRIPAAIPINRRDRDFCERLPGVRRAALLRDLPADEGAQVARFLIHKVYRRGASLYHRGEPAERLYLIDSGHVTLIDPVASHREPQSLSDGDLFGSFAMLTGIHHTTTAIATIDTSVWELRRVDLEQLLRQAPTFTERLRRFIAQGEAASYLHDRHHIDPDKATRWARSAERALDSGTVPEPATALLHKGHEAKGAPLAIFLGITLDGIPESLVIGASMVQANVSLSLIAGLFLSNFPEALSSSVGMRQQGMSFTKVFLMWTALMLITGVGAAAGSQFFIGADANTYALVEGLAAGAMLTMIAETMLPEAYFKGGSVVGISTLFGFLIAIFFKTLE